MKIKRQNRTLIIYDVQELSAANARMFRDEICAAFSPELKDVEIDLSQTRFMDGSGLGALASLYVAAGGQGRGGILAMRLLHPQPRVQQLLELARMHHIFEIIPRQGGVANAHTLTNSHFSDDSARMSPEPV